MSKVEQDAAARAPAEAEPRTPHQRLAEIGGRQHGLVTWRQARAAGFSAKQISGRLARNVWSAPLPVVLKLGVGPLSSDERLQLGLLLAGEGSALSHGTAAGLWELPLPLATPAAIEVTAPKRQSRPQPGSGYRLHWSRRLTEAKVRVREGHRVTCIEWTLVDLANAWSKDPLERALENALRRNLTSLAALASELAEHGHHLRGGARVLQRLLAARGAAQVDTDSELEVDFEQFTRRFGIPPPTRQVRVGSRRCDFAWEASRLIAEVDGAAFHCTQADRARDELRRIELTANGYRVVCIQHKHLKEKPAVIAQLLRKALGVMSQDKLNLVVRHTAASDARRREAAMRRRSG